MSNEKKIKWDWGKFTLLMRYYHLSKSDVWKQLRIPNRSTLYSWIDKDISPRVEHGVLLANMVHTPVEELCGVDTSSRSKKYARFYRIIDEIPEAYHEELHTMLRSFADTIRYRILNP